jgi:two-component system CheB/CheR fusion protein
MIVAAGLSIRSGHDAPTSRVTLAASVNSKGVFLQSPQGDKTMDDPAAELPPAEIRRHFIVAIGASAGGLEALSALIAHLPTDLNVPYVILQHLSPTYRSMLAQLLGRETAMAVREIEDGMVPEANTIYTTPPNRNLEFRDDRFLLIAPAQEVLPKPSVNTFLYSLAEARGEGVIGVVLSGTGSDGASGLRAVKASGGLTFAQDPATAKYSGMPQAAIDTDCVDWVLAPADIAREIAGIVRTHGQIQPPHQGQNSPATLKTLLAKVHRYTKVDFSGYKETTVWRRILRRMAANRVASLDEYIALTRKNPDELGQLCKDILISVTSFFRDGEAFVALRRALEERLATKRIGDEVRIWVPGCATGEEVYSIAILLSELLGAGRHDFKIQLFATDIDQAAMNIARRGHYSEASLAGVDPGLVARYFKPHGDTYEISKELREMVVFARQNVVQDPPFLRLDLVSCRNLLIYFQNSLQERVLDIFHYALAPAGLLFLGKSESTYQRDNLFDTVHRDQRIFRRRDAPVSKSTVVSLMMDAAPPHRSVVPAKPRTLEERFLSAASSAYVPPSVLINAQMELLHVFGDVSDYLGLPVGRVDFNLLTLIRKEFRTEVQTLVHQAQHKRAAVYGRQHDHDKSSGAFRIAVHPIPGVEVEPLLLIAFEPVLVPDAVRHEHFDLLPGLVTKDLEDELIATREHLQTVIEELETSNEETQALNEEMQASNEELQAANEELQAANEELQSTNEELTTVNEELQIKSAELGDANADLESIQSSVDYAIVVAGEQQRLLRYNDTAARLFGLSPARVGNSLRDVLAGHRLSAVLVSIDEVIRTRRPLERQLTEGGCHYLLRASPRMTAQGDVRGCVLSLLDETPLFEVQRELRDKEQRLMSIMTFSTTLISVKDTSGRYEFVNPRFEQMLRRMTGLGMGDILGKTDQQVFPPEIARTFRERDLDVLRTGEASEIREVLSIGGEAVCFIALRFPMMSDDGVITAVCTKLVDISRLAGELDSAGR